MGGHQLGLVADSDYLYSSYGSGIFAHLLDVTISFSLVVAVIVTFRILNAAGLWTPTLNVPSEGVSPPGTLAYS